MKALIIGATGATGKDLVKVVLKDGFYSEVVIFVRCTNGVVHPKLKEIIADFEKPGDIAKNIKGGCFVFLPRNHSQSRRL
jgi:uncharacterized protein YbjT (DUF2867 family)